jgi:hypothetical protein
MTTEIFAMQAFNGLSLFTILVLMALGLAIVFDLVAEVTQRRIVKRKGQPQFDFYGGATLLIDPKGKVRYLIRKSIINRERLEKQRHFVKENRDKLVRAFQEYWTLASTVSNRMIHQKAGEDLTSNLTAMTTQFNQITVATRNGYVVKVSDIGKAEESYQEPRSAARLDGVPAVTLIVAKQSLPVLRRNITRPVIPTCSPVAVSGGRSGWAARICARLWVRSTATG